MTDSNKLTRRDFTVSSALALLSGVAITITGCSDSSDSPTTPGLTTTTTPAPTPPTPSDVTGTIGANHGHTAVVTAAELTSDDTVILDITGDASHPHTVELTPADLDQIAADTRVTKTSTTNAEHAHSVTFN